MNENTLTCPKCEASVSKEDNFCRRCGTRLKIALEPLERPEPSIVPPSPPPYTRRLGVIQRLYGALRRPSETMRDIGLAPDYGGVATILILKIALMIAALSIAMSKVHITGSYATEVMRLVYNVIALTAIIGVFLIILRWAVKSAIVWKACDEGSGWSFSNAAAVTGYAYTAEVVVNIIMVVTLPFFVPVFHLDVDNLEAAAQAAQALQSQLMLLSIYRLPITFLTLIWKSYLGGIGTHYGTREMCSKTMGIAVFFLLGLIGLIIDTVGALV